MVQWSRPCTEKLGASLTKLWLAYTFGKYSGCLGTTALQESVSTLTGDTVEVWDMVQVRCKLSTRVSPLTPFNGNPDVLPTVQGFSFVMRQDANCKRFGTLFEVDWIMRFEQIQSNYGLPSNVQRQYIALRHWLLQPHIRPHASRPLTSFEKWLLTCTSDKCILSDINKFRNALLLPLSR